MRKPLFLPYPDRPIDAVILDLGGVLLNIDYQATAERFKALGIGNFDALYSQARQSQLFDGFEVGLTGREEFRERLRHLAQMPLSDEQIDGAWNAMLLDLPPHRAELVGLIKAHYRTLLLSNTNAIHYAAFMESPSSGHIRRTLTECFHATYFSHLIHMRKPSPEVFRHVIGQNGLNPSRTLFIDDSPQHVEGARAVGLVGYHLRVGQGETLEGLFHTGP